MDVAWRQVFAACWNRKAFPVVVLNADTEPSQQLQSDFDVWLGNQLTDNLNANIAGSNKRQRHQQCTQKLTGHIPADKDRVVKF